MSVIEHENPGGRTGNPEQPEAALPAGPAADPDLARWPAMRRPEPAPFRAAIARTLLRRVAPRTGIRVEMPDGSTFGRPDGPLMQMRRPDAFFDRVGRDGKIGFGESYMAGDWDAPDLAGLLEPMAANLRSLVPTRLQWIRRFYEPQPPPEELNDHSGARRNISRHYDLSNELFALFLDRTMTYSSALFEHPDDPAEPLEQAQARKIDRLLDSAGVREGSRVLEIGTGWGELAIRAARRGATVTSLTLSAEQAELARRRLAEEGLDASARVLVQDYRDATGTYDAVVSVEMIEAVGEKYWPVYFRTLEERLAPTGRIALQSILMRHDGMVAARSSWTWIHKYVFPGGIIPSLESINDTVRNHTSLRVLGRHHFGASYAETLRRWRERFMAREAEVEALGFDRTFRRMWEFYLAYSEAGFRSGHLDVAQLVLARRPR
jgi:cyclopropane-fatty-acyl-phospholipid synthase